MLFVISFILFAVHVLILLKDKDYRWLGLVLGVAYFLVIVLFGNMFRSVFDLDQDSKAFFTALAFIYSVVPLGLAEIAARFFPAYKTS